MLTPGRIITDDGIRCVNVSQNNCTVCVLRLRFANSIACRVDKNGVASTAIVVVALGIIDTGRK
jgi:hypothetical protein